MRTTANFYTGLFLLLLLSKSILISPLYAEDGYRLWLRYDPLSSEQITKYQPFITQGVVPGRSATMTIVRNELAQGLSGLLGKEVPMSEQVTRDGAIIAGTPDSAPLLQQLSLEDTLRQLGEEGYWLFSTRINNKACTVITANTEVGVLYGVFHFLRLMQTGQTLAALSLSSRPKVQLRILNHWDNLDGSVERGYAGASLWQWHELPTYKDPRYADYARANASIGINGTVLTNVNANALVLTEEYLRKVAALADIFRPYGIKVYLTARFSAPIETGGLATADPLDTAVIAWWKTKADEIYRHIPDFGGFLVKANSEGQPGPQNYNRSHADGANMLADAVASHGGVVMWRAFVYDNNVPDDRAKQAYNEFVPLDGQFRDNVLVQVKNGPIDFQPREPFHPLFGAMPETPLMLELQVTQEYFGQGLHLTYLAPYYKECLQSDTYAKGKGSYVAQVIDGTLHDYPITGMAGVSNIGANRNWTGHPFGQANWFTFGRLAWNPALSAEAIAQEWIQMTFSEEEQVVQLITDLMMMSYEAAVNYRTPLGLHHLMAWHHHYGPGPWIDEGRADWTPVYYHRADSGGIGFDRTTRGSDAVSQYFPEVRQKFNDITTVPENLLLWFHHVDWDHRMQSGRTLWEALCYKYYEGVDTVRQMKEIWHSLEGNIDSQRYEHVKALLEIQLQHAIEWRNACVLYFQTYSQRPIPSGLEKPDKTLDYYKSIERKYLPGS